jgi:phenylacetic acid degradation operon negative regulatory protein
MFMSPSPKKLILNLLLAADGTPLTAADAVRAGGFFGIRENSVRVALVRLSSEGLLASAGRGAYSLGPSAVKVAQALSSWRRAESQVCDWTGRWIAVGTGSLGRSDRTAVRQRERALALAGLRDLDGNLHVRPDNLAGGAPLIRERLRHLGLPPEAPVFIATDLEAALDAHARTLWQGQALSHAYVATQRQLETWMARADELEPEVAARESYLLGNDAIRQLVYDPLLPAPLVNTEARHAFTQAVIAFDEAGHRIWRTVMPNLAPPHLSFSQADANRSKPSSDKHHVY